MNVNTTNVTVKMGTVVSTMRNTTNATIVVIMMAMVAIVVTTVAAIVAITMTGKRSVFLVLKSIDELISWLKKKAKTTISCDMKKKVG